jgi:hypothetical protein
VGEFTPCFLRVVARFSAHADPNTLIQYRTFCWNISTCIGTINHINGFK